MLMILFDDGNLPNTLCIPPLLLFSRFTNDDINLIPIQKVINTSIKSVIMLKMKKGKSHKLFYCMDEKSLNRWFHLFLSTAISPSISTHNTLIFPQIPVLLSSQSSIHSAKSINLLSSNNKTP